MDIKIMIARNDEDDDVVVLQNGERYAWTAFLNNTESAVSACRIAMETPRGRMTEDIFNAGRSGYVWLHRCGVRTTRDFEDLMNHLPLLRLPTAPSVARRCRKCGARIWGRAALLTGLGSECRRNGHSPARPLHRLTADRPLRAGIEKPCGIGTTDRNPPMLRQRPSSSVSHG